MLIDAVNRPGGARMTSGSLAERVEGENPAELLWQEGGAKAFPIPGDIHSEIME